MSWPFLLADWLLRLLFICMVVAFVLDASKRRLKRKAAVIRKRMPGVRGLGLVYDTFTSSLILTLGPACWKWHWPHVGNCTSCGHSPRVHIARRDRGMIEWRCDHAIVLLRQNPKGNYAVCACKHYDPERAAA